jgi:hypothetical protein
MPVESISRIVARVKQAPPSRPISVFIVEQEGKRQLDAIYGKTIESIRRQTAVKAYHPSDRCPTCGQIQTQLEEEYLGDFHNNMPLKDVREFLLKAMET